MSVSVSAPVYGTGVSILCCVIDMDVRSGGRREGRDVRSCCADVCMDVCVDMCGDAVCCVDMCGDAMDVSCGW